MAPRMPVPWSLATISSAGNRANAFFQVSAGPLCGHPVGAALEQGDRHGPRLDAVQDRRLPREELVRGRPLAGRATDLLRPGERLHDLDSPLGRLLDAGADGLASRGRPERSPSKSGIERVDPGSTAAWRMRSLRPRSRSAANSWRSFSIWRSFSWHSAHPPVGSATWTAWGRPPRRGSRAIERRLWTSQTSECSRPKRRSTNTPRP